MRGSILQVLNLDSHHSAGERPCVTLLLWLRGLELRGQRRVQRVCQEDKLELNLKSVGERRGGKGHSDMQQQKTKTVSPDLKDPYIKFRTGAP